MAEYFNELELAILHWLKSTYLNSQLTLQIESAKFFSSELTKVGFYVYFEVSKDLESINLDDFGGKWPINGPNLESDDIQNGGGTLVWGTDGYIDCIEMYANGDFFNELVKQFELTS